MASDYTVHAVFNKNGIYFIQIQNNTDDTGTEIKTENTKKINECCISISSLVKRKHKPDVCMPLVVMNEEDTAFNGDGIAIRDGICNFYHFLSYS